MTRHTCSRLAWPGGLSGKVLHIMLTNVSHVGAPAKIQEAAALTFGRLFLMPSIRMSTLLGHVGAGICAGNSKVCSTTVCHSGA